MKRLFAALLVLVLFIAFTACTGRGNTPAASSEPTEKAADNTQALTQEPTALPTAEPTAAPAPTFAPYSAATGRLTEGPFLPEGAEYVVIKGESDIFYVYDSMGELRDMFHCETNENVYSGTGIFGPKGVTCGRLISTGEQIGGLSYLGDIIFTTKWYENYDDDDHYFYHGISSVFNSELELMCEFDGEEAQIGEIGGILHVDGRLIVLDRSMSWENDSVYYENAPKMFSESGEYLGTLDTAPFGFIMGVLGSRYILGCGEGNSLPDMDYWEPVLNVYTLDGTCVMEKVAFDYPSSAYAAESELSVGILYGVDYVTAADGTVYDCDLNPIAEEPDPMDYAGRLARPYIALDLEDAVFSEGGVYAGVKDGEGNWLFRIYNPGNASDSDTSDGERFWRIYGISSSLQNIWWD